MGGQTPAHLFFVSARCSKSLVLEILKLENPLGKAIDSISIHCPEEDLDPSGATSSRRQKGQRYNTVSRFRYIKSRRTRKPIMKRKDIQRPSIGSGQNVSSRGDRREFSHMNSKGSQHKPLITFLKSIGTKKRERVIGPSLEEFLQQPEKYKAQYKVAFGD